MLAEINELFRSFQEKHNNHSAEHDYIKHLNGYGTHSNQYQGGKILLVSVVNKLSVVSFYRSNGSSMFQGSIQ